MLPDFPCRDAEWADAVLIGLPSLSNLVVKPSGNRGVPSADLLRPGIASRKAQGRGNQVVQQRSVILSIREALHKSVGSAEASRRGQLVLGFIRGGGALPFCEGRINFFRGFRADCSAGTASDFPS